MDTEVDVVIVGARCAGSSLARLLASSGRRVTVVDRASFPSDRLSTHLLLEKGVQFLHRWGLLDELLARGVPAVPLTRFTFGDWWVDLQNETEPGHSPRWTCAPRRVVLDELLVEAARDAGATVLERTRVVDVCRQGDRVTGVHVVGDDGSTSTIRARVVVGADGLHSTVGKLVGAATTEVSEHTTCQVYGYWRDVDQSHMELGLRPGCAFGSFVCDDDLLLVSISRPVGEWRTLWSGGEDAYRNTLAEWFPAAAERVFAGRLVSALRGTNDLPNRLVEAAGPGWALIGDAAMHKDPVTGLGMSDAFHGAAILAHELSESLDGPDEMIDAALGSASLRFREATRTTFDIACRLASHRFDVMELPGLVTGLSEAIHAEMVDAAAVDERVAS